jgi:hypothetical protein
MPSQCCATHAEERQGLKQLASELRELLALLEQEEQGPREVGKNWDLKRIHESIWLLV